jgi:hypothetical protein
MMLGHLFEINLRLNKLNYVWTEYEEYIKHQDRVPGELSENTLNLMLDTFINANQFDRVFTVMDFAVRYRIRSLNSYVKRLELLSDKLSDAEQK